MSSNKTRGIIAIDRETLCVALSERQRNGYEIVWESLRTIVISGQLRYYCVVDKKEDMRYKISEILKQSYQIP